MSSWDTNSWSNFCDPHWELIFHNKWHPGTLEKSKPPKMAVETHFHVWNGTKTSPVFLPVDGKAYWLVHPGWVSLVSCGTVQPENNYFRHSLQRGKYLPLKKLNFVPHSKSPHHFYTFHYPHICGAFRKFLFSRTFYETTNYLMEKLGL